MTYIAQGFKTVGLVIMAGGILLYVGLMTRAWIEGKGLLGAIVFVLYGLFLLRPFECVFAGGLAIFVIGILATYLGVPGFIAGLFLFTFGLRKLLV